MNKDLKEKFAFTLAEVLITLGIIGIVSAMTIPTLVNKYQEKVTVTKVKKTYNILTQAHKLATIENGPQSSWGISDSKFNGKDEPKSDDWVENDESMSGRDLYIDKLAPYLKITTRKSYKECYGNSNINFTTLSGRTVGDTYCPMATLPDGTTIVNTYFHKTAGLGDFKIDINGEAGPNTIGKDIFIFWAYDTGIFKTNPSEPVKEYIDDNCLKTNANGYGCTAWVIEHGNMDYLHCDDLSWNNKTKCD